MTVRSPLWMENDSFPASLDRQLIEILFSTPGVVASGDYAVTQRAAGTNRSVDVAAGHIVVEGGDTADQGKYVVFSDTFVNKPLAAAPGAGLTRIDAIVVRVRDADAIGGLDNDGLVDVIQGTPASSPTAPAIDPSCELLAYVSIANGVTVITNALITDARQVALTRNEFVGKLSLGAGATVPFRKLVADHTAVSRITYSRLFAEIGTTYGAGDGSTTFNLPDFRGRVPVGAGTGTAHGATAHTLGQMPTTGAGGEETHLLLAAESGFPGAVHVFTDPEHDHDFGVPTSDGNAEQNGVDRHAAETPGTSTTAPAATGITIDDHDPANAVSEHNTMQPHTVVKVLIQA